MPESLNSYGEDVSGKNNVHRVNEKYPDDDYRAYCHKTPLCPYPCVVCSELTDPDMRQVLESQANRSAREDQP